MYVRTMALRRVLCVVILLRAGCRRGKSGAKAGSGRMDLARDCVTLGSTVFPCIITRTRFDCLQAEGGVSGDGVSVALFDQGHGSMVIHRAGR